MGTFTCKCGALIQDSSYPNPLAGDLYWQVDQDQICSQAITAIRAFLNACARGDRNIWLVDYFQADYPSTMDEAEVIDDIYTKVGQDKGHCVYLCPECDRFCVQKRSLENDWRCYEPKD